MSGFGTSYSTSPEPILSKEVVHSPLTMLVTKNPGMGVLFRRGTLELLASTYSRNCAFKMWFEESADGHHFLKWEALPSGKLTYINRIFPFLKGYTSSIRVHFPATAMLVDPGVVSPETSAQKIDPENTENTKAWLLEDRAPRTDGYAGTWSHGVFLSPLSGSGNMGSPS